MSFLGEIKRRKIFQVAAVYAVVAWLLIQIVATVEEPLNLPAWFDTAVIVLLAIGFPITLIMSWGFNLTSEGLVREGAVAADVAGRPRRGIEFLLIGLIVVALFWLVYRVEFSEPETVAAPSEATKSVVDEVTAETSADVLPNSIAVLPFENLSPDPDNAYFAAGIHESTLNQLGKISDLIVIASASVMKYANDPAPIPEIANALNVETVMVASVRYADGRVRISPRLIDGQSGAQLWSDEFDRELTDVFAVQADVAEQIATAMQVQLLPDEQARLKTRPTASAEAYRHYLHALSLPHPAIFPEYLSAHIESLKRAIQADPNFAEAYAGLAWAYYASPPERHLAVEYAQKAIGLDPTVGVAHFVIGQSLRYYYTRQDEARAAFERAIEFSPNDSDPLMGSVRHLAEQSGQYEDAIRIGRRAVAIDPQPSAHSNLGFIYLRAGNLTAAARQFREAIRLDPDVYVDYLDLATVEYLDGDSTVAKEILDHAVRIMSPSATFRADYITYLYGLLGEPEHAVRFIAGQNVIIEDPGDDSWETLGWAALGTRDKDLALRVWTSTVDGYLNDNRPVSLGRITRLRDNWLNDPILEQPEFLELRRRLGFKG